MSSERLEPSALENSLDPVEPIEISDPSGQAALSRDSEEIPDLRVLIPEAQAGSEAASYALHVLRQQIIDRGIKKYQRSNLDLDEVRSATTEKLFRADFDPLRPIPEHIKPEDEAELILRRYGSYIMKTLRSVAADRMSQNVIDAPAGLRYEAPAPSQAARHKNGDATKAIADELIRTILTEQEGAVFYLQRDGLKNAEISEQLGIDRSDVEPLVNEIMAKLETHVLHPAGLYRFSTVVANSPLHEKVAYAGLKQGTIQAVKILRYWYVKPEWLLPLIPPEDMVPLNEVANNATVLAFRRRHSDRLTLHNSKIYVRTADLQLVQEIAEEKKRKHIPTPPPEPGYISIADLDCTAKEQSALNNAARTGTFSRMVTQRRRQFVPEEEARAWLEIMRAQQLPMVRWVKRVTSKL